MYVLGRWEEYSAISQNFIGNNSVVANVPFAGDKHYNYCWSPNRVIQVKTLSGFFSKEMLCDDADKVI